MGLFDNITFMNEGEQADAYRARKEAERDAETNKEKENFERRYVSRHPGSKYTREYMKVNGTNIVPSDKAIEDLERHGKSTKKVWDYSKANPDQAHKREDDANRAAGFSQKEIDKMNKFNYSDDDSSEADAAYMTNIRKTNRFKDGIRLSGAMQAADAANRHMRRHPDQYKESGLFESVEFI